MATLFIDKERHQTQVFYEDLGDGQRLELVRIPGGSFLMGSPEDENERLGREGPQHEVTVAPFVMGRYPVTQAQWRIVAGFAPVNPEVEMKPNPSRFSDKDDSVGEASLKENKRPVEQVSWHEAVEFCARLSRFAESRLSQHTKRNYRLPSEVEWEYACRAGTTTPFSCGETITTDIANYNGNYTYGQGPTGEYRQETTPVDHFNHANPWGLSDMHGNVFEWCLDHWHENYKDAPTDGSAWIEGGDSGLRVIRGGSWYDTPRWCRSASRDLSAPDIRDIFIGFRVVLAPP